MVEAQPEAEGADEQPQSQLLSLPEECLMRILSLNDCVTTLLLIAAVSRKLRVLARRDELWKAHLANLWAEQPKPHMRAYGLRRWLLCDATVASLDGKGMSAPRYMPFRCAETPHCRIQVELGWQESVQASCGYFLNLKAALALGSQRGLPEWAFPGYYDMCDAGLIDHEWEIYFDPRIGAQAEALGPAAAIFHEDGCYEDSHVFLRRSRFCEWGLKRQNHTGAGPGNPAVPWPGELGDLGLEITPGGKHTIVRALQHEWVIQNNVVTLKATGLRAERVTGCRAVGLVSRPELNGRECTVESFNPEKGRYVVTFTDASPSAAPRLTDRKSTNWRSQAVVRGGEKVSLKPASVVLPPMAAVELCGLEGDLQALNGQCGRVAPTERVGSLVPSISQAPLPVGASAWEADGSPPTEQAVRIAELPSGSVCLEDAPAKVVRIPIGKCMLQLR